MLLVLAVINWYVLNDKLSKPFKSYLGKDSVYNFINSMVLLHFTT